jgi:protein-S-isoprenylcysteine O-methyltransferase Ste14
MATGKAERGIDAGRLAIVPVFGLFLIAHVHGFVGQLASAEPVNAIWIATSLHRLLVICFYGLFVLFYLLRRPAALTTDSLFVKSVAIVATFTPLALPALGRPLSDHGIVLFADLVTIVGMIITVCSLGALGRSIGIIPQARSLVRTGPYRIVRHPVYLGELISVLGIVIARFTPAGAGLFCLLAAAQLYRALQEEKLLAVAFPEYNAWFLTRARFIPGIF